jgi:hypothetical protein
VVFAGAAAARDGLEDLDLFAGTGVLDKVPDVHDAIVAGVGALVLVVVILILTRWVRGCARLLCGHEDTPSWSGSGRLLPRRAVFMPLHPEVYHAILTIARYC